jgi:hypothetical protein
MKQQIIDMQQKLSSTPNEYQSISPNLVSELTGGGERSTKI